jgi:hypothetical protein
VERIVRFLPLGLFCALSAKLIVLGASLSDVGVLFLLSTVLVVFSYKQNEEFSTLRSEIEALKNKHVQIKEEVELAKDDVQTVKSLVGGIKLGQQLRSPSSRN